MFGCFPSINHHIGRYNYILLLHYTSKTIWLIFLSFIQMSWNRMHSFDRHFPRSLALIHVLPNAFVHTPFLLSAFNFRFFSLFRLQSPKPYFNTILSLQLSPSYTSPSPPPPQVPFYSPPNPPPTSRDFLPNGLSSGRRDSLVGQSRVRGWRSL